MTFTQSVQICLGPKYFFKFAGRASRSEYWWFVLFTVLINIASAFFWLFPPNYAFTLNLLLGVALVPPSLGVTVRRLHDRNLSGLWVAIPMLLAGGLGAAGQMALNPFTDLLTFVVYVAFFVVLCLPGQPGVNRFGQNPLDGPPPLNA